MNYIMGISRYRKIYGWTDTQLDAMRDEIMLLRKDRRVKQLATEKDMPIDRFWREVGALKTGEDLSYKLVSQLAAVMLVIPHSNASPERIFSMINKNLSPERSRLNKDTTLNHIMIIKTSSLLLSFQPTLALLIKAKQATRCMLSGTDWV